MVAMKVVLPIAWPGIAAGTILCFLLTLNEVIHPEVRKLFPGAYAPEFDFRVSSPEVLELGYVSFRDMCAFAEGLIEGSANHYGETVAISQISAPSLARCLSTAPISPRIRFNWLSPKSIV